MKTTNTDGIMLEKVSNVVDRLSPGILRSTTHNKPIGNIPIVSQSETGFVGYHDGVAGVEASSENPVVTFANHTCVARWHEANFSTIQNVFPLRGKPELLDTLYLYWFLKSTIVPSFYGGHWPILTDKLIPVPAIQNQRQIATSLQSQFLVIEQARTAAQLQLTELTNLANAIIRQSVEHPDTAPAKLGDVLDEVKKGVGKTWAEYPVLGATRAGLALAKEPVGKVPERYKPVLHGTVFYNPMRIMIGSIAMVDELDTPGITSPDYVALRGKEGLVDSRWFYYWLRSPYGVSCIASLARGAVRERMLFNRLAEGSIELPSYTVQVTAAKALAELKPMRSAIEKQLAEINLLPGKILAKAFDSL
jgi:type I restriction enzyme S subunit